MSGEPDVSAEPDTKRRRLGLRARVIVAFAVGAFLLSGLLSVVTYTLTRNNLVEAVQEEARQNAAGNALIINDNISGATNPMSSRA